MPAIAILRRICFISPYAYPLLCGHGAGPGGAERQFLLIARELAKAGWQVCFVTHTPVKGLVQGATEFRVLPVDFRYMGGCKLYMPLAWLGLLLAMRQADSDFYVLKVPGHLLPLMAVFCRLFTRRLIFWSQMSYDANPREREGSRFAGYLQDIGVRLANVVVAQSQQQCAAFMANYRVRAHVIPSICRRLDKRPECAQSPDVDVLWAGNSQAKKRPQVVLELARQMPYAQFTVALNVGDKVLCSQLAKEADGIHNIRFLLEVEPVEMERWFQRTRIVVNTSLHEGFPNAYLQAWMNGVPVVSLGVDPDHLIRRRQMGRVVDEQRVRKCSENPGLLAGCLVPLVHELLDDDALRLRLGANGRSYVREEHSAERVIPALIAVLEATSSA